MEDQVQNSNFPAWYYGPDGESQIFDREEDVPEGWTDHPTNVSNSTSETPEYSSSEPLTEQGNVPSDAGNGAAAEPVSEKPESEAVAAPLGDTQEQAPGKKKRK